MAEQIKKNAVAVNAFVRRQTKESPFSYYDGPLEDLAKRIEVVLADLPQRRCYVRSGSKDGVILVNLSPVRFYSGVVDVTEATPVVVGFEARREGEEKHLVVRARGPKAPAKLVEVVLYRRDILEPQDRSAWLNAVWKTDEVPVFAEWELISINARATLEEEPMHPLAMARNMLGKPGGTSATYTAEQFAEAIWYWSKRAMAAGPSAETKCAFCSEEPQRPAGGLAICAPCAATVAEIVRETRPEA